MKTCTKCGLALALSEFYARPDSNGKLRSHCKRCMALAKSVPKFGWARAANKAGPKSDRYLARTAVSKAIRLGHLVRERCETCDSTNRVYAHHDSYREENWLKIRWLCAKCHHTLHRKLELSQTLEDRS